MKKFLALLILVGVATVFQIRSNTADYILGKSEATVDNLELSTENLELSDENLELSNQNLENIENQEVILNEVSEEKPVFNNEDAAEKSQEVSAESLENIEESTEELQKEIKEEETKVKENIEPMAKTLNRSEIDPKYKWNMEDIYKSWQEWENDVKVAQTLMNEIIGYKGKIKDNVDNFIKMSKAEDDLSMIVNKLYVYTMMLRDINSTDEDAAKHMQELEKIFTDFSVATSWISSEILSIPKETMDRWIDEHVELQPDRFNINELYRLQKHVLDEDRTKLLAYYGQYMGAPDDIYKELSTSDIQFREITLSDGTVEKVTNGAYSRILSTARNQDDRKKAFEALYGVFDDNKNTYAAIYRSLLQRNDASARAHNFKSTLERALEGKNVPEEVFLSLLRSALANNKPLQRYVNLRKKAMGLAEYHYYDNSINIVDYTRKFPYEEGKDLVMNAVAPLGEDYSQKVARAIGEGWLDVFETENKRSGAYSVGIYGVHPYMLLNYESTLDDVFTLAHEMGHTIHTMLSEENQPYATSDYTIFVAEVASTFNERLLLDYMLSVSTDPTEKIALIEQALGNIVGTYYIQTLFANYEYQAHKMVEEGLPITQQVLSDIMDKLFKDYFGDTLAMDDLQKVIWARIPHFFNSPYYVYQYSTSFASSANLYDRVTNPKYTEAERAQAREDYLTLLKSGGNDHPMEQLKKAGVDLSRVESFDAVGKEFDRLLDILEAELAKLEK